LQIQRTFISVSETKFCSYYNQHDARIPLRLPIKGVARNLFWGHKFLLHNTTVLYILTSSTAISAQNNFQGLILYRYRPTPRRYGPVTHGGDVEAFRLARATFHWLGWNLAWRSRQPCRISLPSVQGCRVGREPQYCKYYKISKYNKRPIGAYSLRNF